MKKVGAILAAVAMVVVAFVIRGSDDDEGGGGDGSGRGVGELICPTDLREICDQIAGVEVTYERAGATADRLLAAGGDADDTLNGQAWVVPAAWADSVNATRRFEAETHPAINADLFTSSSPIASTGIALAWFEDVVAAPCTPVTWECLGNNLSNRFRVGSPPVSSAIGLPVAAAQLVEILGAEFDRRDVRLPDFIREATAFRDMRTLGPAGFVAVGTTSADAYGVDRTNTGIPIAVSVQPDDVRIDLVIVTRRGQSLPRDLESAIAEASRAAHWGPPGSGPSGMPNGDLLNVIREKHS